MRFTRFKIPPEKPKKVGRDQYKCNARMRVEENETYCETITENNARCKEHDVNQKLGALREEARLGGLIDTASIEERVRVLEEDKRNLTRLDTQIYTSLATLQELERRFPMTTISPNEAVTMARLREKYATLMHQRVDLETKLKALLDTNFIYDEAAKLFEEKVVDTNSKTILLEGIGTILDKIVESGNSKSVEETK